MANKTINKHEVEWKREITIRFWRDENEAIPGNHLEALEEAGFVQAQKMISEGYTSGELLENICAVGDPIDGIEYSGWWELSS